MAVLRASLAQIPIVLVSATPSLETVVNVARGRYERVALPRRHAAAELPAVRLVDMRRERIEPGRFLAPPLVAELAATFEAGRAGAAVSQPPRLRALTLCRACGHRFQCPSCTGLARRAPFYPAALVPPLRARRGGAAVLPGMPRRRRSRPVRAGGRTPARGSDGAVSGGPHGTDGQRSACPGRAPQPSSPKR